MRNAPPVAIPGWLRAGSRTYTDWTGGQHDLDRDLEATALHLARAEAELDRARRRYEEAKARVERWDAEHGG